MADNWKLGDEFLPFHHDASHVSADYRDGWNACYQAAPKPMTLSRVIAWLEGRAANTDTDPRWLAATQLRSLPGAGDQDCGAFVGVEGRKP